ncbi:DUF547 domain-containing protein [uncultured Formosa sp.]|uniref:DUF547 domain-containing protein n=1 Tax=uncultured Formosa sp. TaxID=255435 RepID=UPI002614650B|nr:DUF547 domain-containing protein [uncultured Formosa sp.]
MKKDHTLLSLSGELLLLVKLQKDTTPLEQVLSKFSITTLFFQLVTDQEKKTFWVNIYNAYYQILANRLSVEGKDVFLKKEITIAETLFSLDDIEHGILRRYRWKKSLGYLPNLFTPTLIRKLAVKEIDYRIHFALNCGAKSCPPIAFYTLEKLNEQLDNAMYAFISSETTIDNVNKTIKTSKLLFWYQGDFGGVKGVRNTLKNVLQVEITSYKLKYNTYSWEPHLDNYV